MIAARRQEAWADFVATDIPNLKGEAFKYCDFTAMSKNSLTVLNEVNVNITRDDLSPWFMQDAITLVFIDGVYVPALSELSRLPKQVVIGNAPQQDNSFAIDEKKFPFAKINSEINSDHFVMSVPAHCHIDAPVHLLAVAVNKAPFVSHPRRLIKLNQDSSMTLMEECVALTDTRYMMNAVMVCELEQSSRLTHYKLQTESKAAIHMASTFVRQKKDSEYVATYLSQGSQFARDDLHVSLLETGAACRTAGFYHTEQKDQYVDHHVNIDHGALCSTSEMLYKGILNNKSRAVFNGRLYVEKGAQKITAYQANHNLLLSNDAEVYSKPELEIYADDVKCKHGATTGQINEDALFYLRSRGISKEQALTILLQSFASEIFTRIEHADFRLRAQNCFGMHEMGRE